MEEVIRIREVRKSMEQSHFFTPVCSPLVTNNNDHPTPSIRFQFPSSTPADRADLYMTLDISSEQDSKGVVEIPEEEEESEPVRKKSAGAKNSQTVQGRRTRNRIAVLDSTASSIDSSTAEELAPTPDDGKRVIHRRKTFVFSS